MQDTNRLPGKCHGKTRDIDVSFRQIEVPRNKKKSSVVMIKFDSARKAREFKRMLNEISKMNNAPHDRELSEEENSRLIHPQEFPKWWEIEMI